jgi:hypothetical protein
LYDYLTRKIRGFGETVVFQNTMFIDIESVKAVVNAAIDSARPPRPSQLSDICRLTYFEYCSAIIVLTRIAKSEHLFVIVSDARQEVQRMVGRRLKYPYKYDPLVILHVSRVIFLRRHNSHDKFGLIRSSC